MQGNACLYEWIHKNKTKTTQLILSVFRHPATLLRQTQDQYGIARERDMLQYLI